MKIKKLKLIIMLLLAGSLTGVWAQEATLAAGGDVFVKNVGSVSYSVGQIADRTQTGSSGSVLQGVQQAYEIFAVTGIENTNINLEVLAYPNPTADNLTLTIKDIELSDLTFQVFDLSGKFLQEGKIAENQTIIDFSSYSPSIYFLKIMQKNLEIKSFKIIKPPPAKQVDFFLGNGQSPILFAMYYLKTT